MGRWGHIGSDQFLNLINKQHKKKGLDFVVFCGWNSFLKTAPLLLLDPWSDGSSSWTTLRALQAGFYPLVCVVAVGCCALITWKEADSWRSSRLALKTASNKEPDFEMWGTSCEEMPHSAGLTIRCGCEERQEVRATWKCLWFQMLHYSGWCFI